MNGRLTISSTIRPAARPWSTRPQVRKSGTPLDRGPGGGGEGSGGMLSSSKVLAQIHPSVEAGHLLRVAVEGQRWAAGEVANPSFGGLAPARMIDSRIHVGVEAILSWCG